MTEMLVKDEDSLADEVIVDICSTRFTRPEAATLRPTTSALQQWRCDRSSGSLLW